jgi:hypothetical protein
MMTIGAAAGALIGTSAERLNKVMTMSLLKRFRGN